MCSLTELASLARRLNREAGAPALPYLYFFTDPERIADPIEVAERLPEGTAIVYRHFGGRDRVAVARRLKRACHSRKLVLLIAADPELALHVGADGVHWPERRLPPRRLDGFSLVTASAHSEPAVARAAAFGADACVISPVFPTNSVKSGRALGLFRAGQIARRSPIATVALGGVNAQTARSLVGRGFAGLAAVDAFAG
jgi:thiamine-phosphate pyrophosphorylase